ncbi:MAG: hypothetical protein ACLRFK_03820 [Alphaproteobacteria bacterium]
MNQMMTSLTETVVQCWGCAVFDRLFQIVSSVGVHVYSNLTQLFLGVFGILFAIFTFNAIWSNFKGGLKDPIMKDSFLKVFIRAVFALTLLGAGTLVPKTISTVIFEPVAKVTLLYSQTMINTNDAIVSEQVTYEPVEITQEGIYSENLRDLMIMLMKTTITQFQSYIKLGLALMDNAFSWKAFFPISNLLKHVILFIIGFYLAWNFIKIFFKYCCYFADVIIAMAFFAFFFPLSLVMVAFKDVKETPKWFGEIGKSVGVAQLKNLINAIVTLGSVVLTYTIMMVIIARFFSASNISVNDLMQAITSGTVYAEDLNNDALYSLSLMSSIALVYILNFVFNQIPQITKMVLSVFGVEENAKHAEQFAGDIGRLSKLAFDNTVKAGKITTKTDKQTDSKSDDKKDSK